MSARLEKFPANLTFFPRPQNWRNKLGVPCTLSWHSGGDRLRIVTTLHHYGDYHDSFLSETVQYAITRKHELSRCFSSSPLTRAYRGDISLREALLSTSPHSLHTLCNYPHSELGYDVRSDRATRDKIDNLEWCACSAYCTNSSIATQVEVPAQILRNITRRAPKITGAG